jgi:hypothetical protein
LPVPGLSVHILPANLSRDQYLAHSLEQMERQDVLYILKGWQTSDGTIKEMNRATELGMEIYFEDDITPEEFAALLLGT